jgi:hypothetical protein
MPSYWFDLPEKSYNELLRLTGTYHREAYHCEEVSSFLAGCVMAGAALEAMLLAMLHLYGAELPEPVVPKLRGKPKPLLRWTLAEMVIAARHANWLPAGLDLGAEWKTRQAKIGDYVEALRQTRNLVHPSRYLQDQSPSRVTKRYLRRSLDILDGARSYIERKIHESIRTAIADQEEKGGIIRGGRLTSARKQSVGRRGTQLKK